MHVPYYKVTKLGRLVSNIILTIKAIVLNVLCILSDITGRDIYLLLEIIGKDTRIGQQFLHPTLGLGETF